MPRKQGNSSYPARPAPAPIAVRPQQPQLIQRPTSFFGTMKEGFAFGIGSSIARNIFESRPPVSYPVSQPQSQPLSQSATQPTQSEIEKMTFTQCMDKTSGNYEMCGHLE